MSKPGSIVGGALLLAAGVLAGWLARSLTAPPSAESAGEDEEAAPHVEPGDMDVEVVTAKAERGNLPLTIPAIGVVRADESAILTLSSRAGGRVTQVNYPVGHDAARGYAIVRFDDAPAKLAVEQAKAALAAAANQLDEFDRTGRERQESELESAARQAVADAAVADAQAARVAALRKDGLASEKAETEAKQAADHAHRESDVAAKALAAFRTTGADLQHSTLAATRDAAQAALKDAEAVRGECEVFPPVDGRITALFAHVGDHVEPGAPVVSLLVGPARVLAFGVTPAQAASVTQGADVTWTDSAGAPHHAVVRSVGAEVGGGAGLVEVAAVPAGDEAGTGPPPQPGLYVRGEIETSHLDGVVLVPLAAVVRAEDEPIVVTVGEGGIAKHVAVKVLGRHDREAAVEGDVKAGDRVVIAGGYNLPDGAKTHEAAAEREPEKPESPK